MRRNRFRELLKNDQPTLGTRILSSWPTIIELVGHSGMFDYVEFSGEYAPYDHATLENMGRAIELFDHLSGMIKIEQESRAHAAVRAIGAGFQSVLFADPRSVTEVEQCVRSVRTERPRSGGLHGVNMHRAALLEGGSEAWADAMDKAFASHERATGGPGVLRIEAELVRIAPGRPSATTIGGELQPVGSTQDVVEISA